MSTHWKALFGVLTVAVVMAAQPSRAMDQAVFETPEAAVESLVEALKTNDDNAMLLIFGEGARPLVEVSDQIAKREEREELYAATQELWQLRGDSTDGRTLIIGSNAWPVPFPIIKKDGGWKFDTEAGFEEIVNRRVGENEIEVIETSNAYVAAQVDYASEDRDADEVLEYAQQFRSEPGMRNGLYWRTGDGEPPSPAGPLIAGHKEYLEGREVGDPFMGYHYRILTGQGEHAPGGDHDYIINGNMIAGFAMVAFPADYGLSGVMTFLVSHHGKVFEKDLGEDTEIVGATLDVFDPDASWEVVGN